MYIYIHIYIHIYIYIYIYIHMSQNSPVFEEDSLENRTYCSLVNEQICCKYMGFRASWWFAWLCLTTTTGNKDSNTICDSVSLQDIVSMFSTAEIDSQTDDIKSRRPMFRDGHVLEISSSEEGFNAGRTYLLKTKHLALCEVLQHVLWKVTINSVITYDICKTKYLAVCEVLFLSHPRWIWPLFAPRTNLGGARRRGHRCEGIGVCGLAREWFDATICYVYTHMQSNMRRISRVWPSTHESDSISRSGNILQYPAEAK